MRGGSMGSSGFGGMMGGMRGLTSGGMNSPNMDNLTDEGIVGSAYDHKVVMRLITYMAPYKRDAMAAMAAVLVYTVASVSIPLFLLFGIKWAVNEGEMWRLHMLGLAFLGVAVIYFAANYLQFIYMPKVGQGVLFSLRTHMFNHLQRLSPSFFHRTPVGRIMSRSQSDVLQLQETFELMVQSVADLLSLAGIVIVMLFIDWRLALVCMSVIPALFLVLGYWQRFARRSFMRIRRAIAIVNGEYNQNITGESFDYGPWRFLPMMDGGFTAAYFDHQGLYAYGRQPNAVAHNVHRLGECLQLIDPALEIKSLFDAFAQTVSQTHVDHLLWRIGLEKTQPEKDAACSVGVWDMYLPQYLVGFEGGLARS
jgi:uncharacterized membrane protein YecN with MAPEG domain